MAVGWGTWFFGFICGGVVGFIMCCIAASVKEQDDG